MKKRNIFTRLVKYYEKNGLLTTFQRIYQGVQHLIFNSQMIVYYAELKDLHDSVLSLPQNIKIEDKSTYADALSPDMQKITTYWDNMNLMDTTRENFEKGAVLWIVKLDEEIAGFGWSIKGKMVQPYYLPLTPHDAVLFDYVTYEEYRGRGLYTLLLNYIFGKLKLEGVSRAFGHALAWNTASIRGIERTFFRKFGIARKFYIFGKSITIWTGLNNS